MCSLEETQSVTIGAATPQARISLSQKFDIRFFFFTSINVLATLLTQIHYFEIPSGIDAVLIEAESQSTKCALISVQNNSVSGWIKKKTQSKLIISWLLQIYTQYLHTDSWWFWEGGGYHVMKKFSIQAHRDRVDHVDIAMHTGSSQSRSVQKR